MSPVTMDISMLLQKFCDNARYLKGYSLYTVRGYRQDIMQYCRFAKVAFIEDVTVENVRSLFFHGRVQRGWSVNTYLAYYKRLNMFFKWCVQQGAMSSNPMAEIEIPRKEKRLPPKLTKENALKLLEIVANYPYEHSYLRHRNHAIFAIVLFAGLRKKEVVCLRLTDVDVENRSLFIRQAKGAKDRILPMSHSLAQILQRHLVERKRLGKTCPQLFASLNRDMGITDIGLRNLVKKMRDASGLYFSLHTLRHTFATLMLEGGCDIYSLSRMMGHEDIKTTTLYLYASANHLRSQILKHPLNA